MEVSAVAVWLTHQCGSNWAWLLEHSELNISERKIFNTIFPFNNNKKNFHSLPAFFFFFVLFSHFSELKRSCPGSDQFCILEQIALWHFAISEPPVTYVTSAFTPTSVSSVVRQNLISINSTHVCGCDSVGASHFHWAASGVAAWTSTSFNLFLVYVPSPRPRLWLVLTSNLVTGQAPTPSLVEKGYDIDCRRKFIHKEG